MCAAGMVPRVLRNGRHPGEQRIVCGAPPQTSLLTLIGELENRNISVPVTFSPEACCIRHRLPDHMVKDGSAVTAGAKPNIQGFPRPRPPRSGPRLS
ncbi:hypothetical protein SAMN02927924_00964 [Sphingobium faniae]|nr:hypothetical protein SAMN02927924_00964 [Sphingobium faniae]